MTFVCMQVCIGLYGWTLGKTTATEICVNDRLLYIPHVLTDLEDNVAQPLKSRRFTVELEPRKMELLQHIIREATKEGAKMQREEARNKYEETSPCNAEMIKQSITHLCCK